MRDLWATGISLRLSAGQLSSKFQSPIFHRTLCTVRGVDDPFGGLTVIISGDWRQTLPIVPGASEATIVNSCLKFSALWNTVEVYHLTENMRVLMSGSSEVQRYSEWLLKVTNCNMTLSSTNMLRLVTEKLVKEWCPSLRA